MTTTTDLTLPDLLDTGESAAADIVATLARVAGLKDTISAREQALRERLGLQLKALTHAAGGKFTLRADDGQAYIAGGNPKPRITDADAFGLWIRGRDDDGLRALAQPVRRVSVADQTRAADALDRWNADEDRPAEVLDALAAALDITTTYALADDALDTVLAREDFKVGDDTVLHVDLATGETVPVPGTTVTVTRETVTVKPDKAARERAAAQIEAALGGPALNA